MKVIIIGSGIAGLSLALACQKNGMEVIVYEKAKQLQNIGGGILLWPHGLRYLKWLALDQYLRSFHVAIKSYDVISHVGEKIFNESYDNFYQAIDGKILPIDRSLLQQVLAKQLIKNTLKLNKNCVHVMSDDNEARVFFADGTFDRADVIVGADGIHSSVRQAINQNAREHYTNYCWWGGVFDASSASFLSKEKVYMALSVSKMCIVWPTKDERFMWYIPVKIPSENFSQCLLNKAQLSEICSDWHAEIHQIIAASTNQQQFSVPIYTLPPQDFYANKRIVLIGDAAHTLGPILGQGASQAIEDAYILFHFLQKLQSSASFIPDIFKQYENLRREKYLKMAELETQAAAMLIHDELETLENFQQQVQTIDLVTMYQALIPLVNEASCLQLRAEVLKTLHESTINFS